MRLEHLNAIANYWNNEADHYRASHPEHLENQLHPSWGLWSLPETELQVMGEDLHPGTRMVDLGCGRGQDAVGFAARGAQVLAIDVATKQLNQRIPHPEVEYAEASAENVPVTKQSVDIAYSDHGAFDHSPPELLLKEMRRILRPGGLLVVCTYSPVALACFDHRTGRLTSKLQRPYASADVLFDGCITAVEYSYADWVRCFTQAGFTVERLDELCCPPGSRAFFDEMVDVQWGSRWPTDILWRVRKHR